MDYSMRNPEEMQNPSLHKELNKIFSYLKRNYMFYYNNYGLRGMSLRGFANLFDKTSECIYKDMICLKKITEDRIKFNAMIDDEIADTYANHKISSLQDFKSALDIAVKLETELEDCISGILKTIATEDICIYKKLIDLAHESQERRFRIETIKNRLDLTSWNMHDLGIISMLVHKHISEKDDLDFELS